LKKIKIFYVKYDEIIVIFKKKSLPEYLKCSSQWYFLVRGPVLINHLSRIVTAYLGFQSMVIWLGCFRVRKSVMVEGHGGAKLLTSWQQEGERGRGWEQNTLFKGTPPVTYFFQLGPTF
jgi:hypothetical protein